MTTITFENPKWWQWRIRRKILDFLDRNLYSYNVKYFGWGWETATVEVWRDNMPQFDRRFKQVADTLAQWNDTGKWYG